MPTQRELLQRWLTLEYRVNPEPGSGESDAAVEELLQKLCARLPSYRPSSAFVEGVVAVARQVPTRVRWFGYWGVRAAVALCAVQAGLLLGGALTVLRPWLQSMSPLGLVTATAGFLARSLEWLLEVPRLGLDAAALGSAMYRAASSPTLLGVLILCVASSAIGLLLLSNLVPSQGDPARDLV